MGRIQSYSLKRKVGPGPFRLLSLGHTELGFLKTGPAASLSLAFDILIWPHPGSTHLSIIFRPHCQPPSSALSSDTTFSEALLLFLPMACWLSNNRGPLFLIFKPIQLFLLKGCRSRRRGKQRSFSRPCLYYWGPGTAYLQQPNTELWVNSLKFSTLNLGTWKEKKTGWWKYYKTMG